MSGNGSHLHDDEHSTRDSWSLSDNDDYDALSCHSAEREWIFVWRSLNHALEEENIDDLRNLIHDYPSLAEMQNDGGITPLHLAIFSNAPLSILQILLNVSPLHVRNSRDAEGRTPLHHACDNSCISMDVLTLLLVSCSDSLGIADRRGWLPLHYACKSDHPAALLELLIWKYYEPPACLGVGTELFETPLHLVAGRRRGRGRSGFEVDPKDRDLLLRMLDAWPVASCILTRTLNGEADPNEQFLPIDFLSEESDEELIQFFEETTIQVFLAAVEMWMHETSWFSNAAKSVIRDTLLVALAPVLDTKDCNATLGFAQNLSSRPLHITSIKDLCRLSGGILQQKLREDEDFVQLVHGCFRMNRAGRLSHSKNSNIDISLRVLESVTEHVGSLFIFLRETPILFSARLGTS